MRVGLIIYGSLETLTGGFLYDRLLVDYLKSQGDEVELISLPWRTYGRHLTDNLSLSLLRRLQRSRFDVLIQDELNHPSLFLINRWLKKRVSYPFIPIVHYVHSSASHSAWLRRLYKNVERQYFMNVHGAIFNCRTTCAAVEELMGFKLPGVVAYPACDHLPSTFSVEKIAERTRACGPLRIMFVANVIPRKGLDTLIDALVQLPESNWQLTVAGSLTMDTAYSNAIRRRIAQANISGRVNLLGAVPNDELPTHLARSHVLAVPSNYEPLGIVYLEAMRFGLPVIASAAGGAREIIDHGQEGFLIPPGDSYALAQCLQEMDQDRERLLQMSLAAYERISIHPTWRQSFQSIREFLQTLIGTQ